MAARLNAIKKTDYLIKDFLLELRVVFGGTCSQAPQALMSSPPQFAPLFPRTLSPLQLEVQSASDRTIAAELKKVLEQTAAALEEQTAKAEEAGLQVRGVAKPNLEALHTRPRGMMSGVIATAVWARG